MCCYVYCSTPHWPRPDSTATSPPSCPVLASPSSSWPPCGPSPSSGSSCGSARPSSNSSTIRASTQNFLQRTFSTGELKVDANPGSEHWLNVQQFGWLAGLICLIIRSRVAASRWWLWCGQPSLPRCWTRQPGYYLQSCTILLCFLRDMLHVSVVTKYCIKKFSTILVKKELVFLAEEYSQNMQENLTCRKILKNGKGLFN